MLCQKNTFFSFFLLLFLGGCGSVSNLDLFSGMTGPNYEPMTNEVAVIASPSGEASGVPLYCSVGRGEARFKNGWASFSNTSFVLKDGMRVPVVLRAANSGGSSASLMAFFDKPGQKILFCPQVTTAANGRIPCASIYALDEDLAMGIRRTFDVPDMIVSGRISCAYDRSHLQNLEPT